MPKKTESKNKITRAVIYARYSCTNQTEQSIEGQLTDCRNFAQRMNLHIVDTYIDRALTATSDRRPQFQKMIADSENGLFDVILVWKLDRFARNRYDSAVYKRRLKTNNVTVMSVMENITDTPEGVLMESMLEGFAEYFSRDLAQKVMRGMRETAKKHKITGCLPFGYTRSPENTYIPDPATAPAVRKIFEMYLAGESKTDIADYLNKHGYKTSYGNTFNKNCITPLVRNTRYVGRYTYDDMELYDEDQRIVSDEVFESAQRKIKANKRTGAMHRAKERYLLTRKIYCGYCKRHMHGESGQSGNKQLHFYYVCSGRKKQGVCNQKRVKKDFIEKIVLNALSRTFGNDKLINAISDAILARQNALNVNADIIAALEQQLTETDKKISNLLTAIEAGIITPTTQERLKELEEIKARLKYDLDIKRAERSPCTKQQLYNFFKTLDLTATATWQEQQALIEHFINRIYVWEDKIVIAFNFTPTRKISDDTDEIDIDAIIKAITEKSSVIAVVGSPSPARTDDPAVNSRMLCQLSYRGICGISFGSLVDTCPAN